MEEAEEEEAEDGQGPEKMAQNWLLLIGVQSETITQERNRLNNLVIIIIIIPVLLKYRIYLTPYITCKKIILTCFIFWILTDLHLA